MSARIPDSHIDIFAKRAFGHLATVGIAGAPHVTPVWVEIEDGNVLVNTAAGRRKDRHVVADSRVALSILDPDDPYRYVGLEGVVVERTPDVAGKHNNQMSLKYNGTPFPFDNTNRVTYRIRPSRVWTQG